MKKSVTLLTQICDLIASGVLSQAEAARRCDVSIASYWSWIAQSQKGNPDFVITFCEEQMPFHDAVRLARKIAHQDILGRFETRVHGGTLEPVFFQGRPQWKEREDLAGIDDDTVAMLGFPDRWERDANGNRVQLMIRHEPAIAGVVKFLESNFRQYQQRSELKIDQKVNLGVSVVSRKPKPLSVIDVTPLPPPPQIERPVDGDWVEAAEDLADLLGPEPVADVAGDPNGSPEPAADAEPEIEMVSQPASEPLVSTRWGNLTESQAAVLAKLKAGIPTNAPTSPNFIVEKFTSAGD
jgi:hypothetical protein